jgi:predicted amidohydrolase YtcJ
MIKDGHRVEALAVKDGKIAATGPKAEMLPWQGPHTKLVDLGGHCLMPGFIDPHSHVVLQSAKFATVNLDPKPIGELGTMADIKRLLREHIQKEKFKPGKWVIGWGYDDTGIKEMRHPNRNDLDSVSTEHPILLFHISNHLCTGNSRLLQEIGVTADTPDPEGGRIQRQPGSNEPNGVLEGTAMLFVVKKLPAPPPEKAMAMLEQGLSYYAAAGITTAQDGASGPGAVKLLKAMAQAGKLPIDVVSYPMYKGIDDALFNAIAKDWQNFGRFRLGGVKLAVDGSIQGYTAYLSKPYYIQPGAATPTPDRCYTSPAEHIFVSSETPAKEPAKVAKPQEGHRGYPYMTLEEVTSWVQRCDAKGIPLLVHINGDAATDRLLEAVAKVRQDKFRPELRTVIIHAQTIREDQLDLAANYGLVPSFFPIHITFWGDRHRDIFLGPERAARISPAKSALKRGMKFTLHHDAPIASIAMLPVAWASVNRITSSGKELGPNQRITPFEALRAITADAAWQYFEENRKGTLEAGKLADLVILAADPLAMEPMKMGDIKVLETIKEGQTVYQGN